MSERDDRQRRRMRRLLPFVAVLIVAGAWWVIGSRRSAAQQQAAESGAQRATEVLSRALSGTDGHAVDEASLEEAIAAFDDATGALPQTPVTLAARIEGQLAIADALRGLRRGAEAAERLRDARTLADALVAIDPRPAPRRLAVDTTLRSAEVAFATGDSTRTLSLITEARANLDLLPPEAADEPPTLDLRRRSHLVEGQTRIGLRETDAAVAAFEQSAAIARTMMSESESGAATAAGLQSLRYLAVAYEVAGQVDAARAAHEELVRVSEAQHARRPAEWFDLSVAYRGYHSFLADHGDADEARTVLARALALDRAAVAAAVDAGIPRSQLVETLGKAAEFELAQMRPQDALAYLDELSSAIDTALDERPDSAGWRLRRAESRTLAALVLEHLGRTAESRAGVEDALAILEELLGQKTADRVQVSSAIGTALSIGVELAIRRGDLTDVDRGVARWLELEAPMIEVAADKADAALDSIRIIAQFASAMSRLPLQEKVRHQLPVLRVLRARISDFAARGPEVQPDVARLRPLFVDVELTIAALTQGIDREAGVTDSDSDPDTDAGE